MSTRHVSPGCGSASVAPRAVARSSHRVEVGDREVEVELLAPALVGPEGGWWSGTRPRPRAGEPSGPVSIA